MIVGSGKRIRRACLCLILAEAAGLLTALSFDDSNISLLTRLEERSPVEFRVVMYRTGMEMFMEKPLAGLGFGRPATRAREAGARLPPVSLLLS